MGFKNTIAGYICVTEKFSGSGMANEEAKRAIESLPLAKDDAWPSLPREAFEVTIESDGITLNYDDTVIHFGMSVKDLSEALDEWLIKFETFFKNIPNAEEAHVIMHLVPYGHFAYLWSKKSIPVSEGGGEKWTYEGGPRNI